MEFWVVMCIALGISNAITPVLLWRIVRQEIRHIEDTRAGGASSVLSVINTSRLDRDSTLSSYAVRREEDRISRAKKQDRTD